MLCRALPIRPATAFASKFQPPCTKSAFSSASRQLTTRPQSILSTRTVQPSQPSRIRIQMPSNRLNSTTTTTTTATRTSKIAEDPDAVLTWNRFLTLRKIRRRVCLVASVVGGLTFFATGITVLTTNDYDQRGAQMIGLDPFITLGLGTFACGALGWLLGPFLGTALFNMYYKRLVPQMRAKEKEFYARIKKFRVDPSVSSMQNPVPDYYGEKIGSVAGYRRWLKDQRAFNLKRGKMV
ncbi:Pam17-domain-containing protein [Venturia nashicola]|uniref:Presequence translocated-associated motor subunit PAM17 n=1 Tax=Venturia nashicola TaxID=86259 RepID=A0A4Z1PGI5_9PEZI|nr:Pam17-domain-containing protein [Venturia nashicola]TLD39486.1 Pam17-domain-containing protein [Venturia nashicola]